MSGLQFFLCVFLFSNNSLQAQKKILNGDFLELM